MNTVDPLTEVPTVRWSVRAERHRVRFLLIGSVLVIHDRSRIDVETFTDQRSASVAAYTRTESLLSEGFVLHEAPQHDTAPAHVVAQVSWETDRAARQAIIASYLFPHLEPAPDVA